MVKEIQEGVAIIYDHHLSQNSFEASQSLVFYKGKNLKFSEMLEEKNF